MAVLLEKDNVVYNSEKLYSPILYLYVNISTLISDYIKSRNRGVCYYINPNFGSRDINDYKLFSGHGSGVKQRPLITVASFEHYFESGLLNGRRALIHRKDYATAFDLKLGGLEMFAYDYGVESC